MSALFEQASIKVEKEQEFKALKQSIERAISPSLIEKFCSKLQKKSIRIREFENILEQRVFEEVDETLAKSGRSAKQLYDSLAVTDKGQMREFYLTSIEEVPSEIREKFHKIYSYY